MGVYKLLTEEVIPELSPLGLIFIDFEKRRLLQGEGSIQKEHYVSDKLFRQMVEDAFLEMLCEEDVPAFNISLEELVNSEVGQPVELICRSYVKEQGLRWVYFQAMVLEKNQEGKPLKIVCCGKDITGAKKLEERLEKKAKQIDELREAGKEALTGPVRTVLELLRMLKDKKLGSSLDQMIIHHLEMTLQNLYQHMMLR